MIGKLIITRSGYDPEQGRHIKDPYLGPEPSMGACRPDVRRGLGLGDNIFLLSGKLRPTARRPSPPQYVVGGFEIAEKISSIEAYRRFPRQRLRERPDGQLTGNVIIDRRGQQHPLDTHPTSTISNRVQNYIVGRNGVALKTHEEIELGRAETMEALQSILRRKGDTPIQLVGRWGVNLTERQVEELRAWLLSIVRRSR